MHPPFHRYSQMYRHQDCIIISLKSKKNNCHLRKEKNREKHYDDEHFNTIFTPQLRQPWFLSACSIWYPPTPPKKEKSHLGNYIKKVSQQ